MNHDELFKCLLKTGRLVRDFFDVVLPGLHAHIDFDRIEFVDKERLTFDGRRRTGGSLSGYFVLVPGGRKPYTGTIEFAQMSYLHDAVVRAWHPLSWPAKRGGVLDSNIEGCPCRRR